MLGGVDLVFLCIFVEVKCRLCLRSYLLLSAALQLDT